MAATISLPQARIPIGYATVDGARIPVDVDAEWMLMFTRLFDRSGGTTGSTSFNEYITQFFDAPGTDPALQQAARDIDDLRQELASTRAELQSLRGAIEDQAVQLAQIRPIDDFRIRIEQIEGRLQ